MGCATSKLDDLPAVALCRDRCGYLQTAIQQRNALADSHLSYTQSLQEIAHSLHTFLDHHHRNSPHDPVQEDDPEPDSGHIEFDSDSEIDSLHSSDHSSPLHHHLEDDPGLTRYPNPDPPSYLRMSYMKNSSMPPSLVYEQRPSSPRRVVYVGESSNYNPYPPSYGPPPSKPPPPPQPRTEGWDFLSLFDYAAPYGFAQEDTREVREEEGIPDLEEDDFHREVVKEVHGKEKLVGKAPVPTVAAVDDKEEPPGGGGGGQASLFQTRPGVSVEKEHEVRVVEKKVVESSDAAPRGGVRRGVPEVAKEIEVQFLRAAESGSEIAVVLQVGKHPNNGRKQASASSKMLPELTPSPSVASSSQPSTSFKKSKASSSSSAVAPPTYADIEAELALRSRNLSSTLHKLHLWEKKLYDEVKAEEKLRLLHERKLRKLKRMDERGTDAPKVDSTRRFVRSLSTKIRIAIQVVDKVSVTINKIRDEELWLQLNQLIQGLSRMWKSMLDCHRSQCEAIKEARGLGSIRASQRLGDDHLEATRVLGHELINWILRFSSWVSAQKGFVRGLNSWLMKCLIYEPEETPDGTVPFSPGRLGAPMIFVICNQWEQALDRVSEKEVVEAMRRFATSVLHLWEQDRLETLERVVGHGGGEEQRIQKEIQELERKMVLVGPGGEDNSVYQSDASNESLQGSLRRVFEAMEMFSAESMRVYDDLLERAAEKEESEED